MTLRTIENLVGRIRHSRSLRAWDPVWDWARPKYETLLRVIAPRGIKRVINETDPIRLDPRLRSVEEEYEPVIWRTLMDHARPGACVIDVGAHVGLYSIAFAKRLGSTGMVYAVEPDPETRLELETSLHLNNVTNRVRVVAAAAGEANGMVSFAAARGLDSRVDRRGEMTVATIRLDSLPIEQKIALVKIDVEGYEPKVIAGATGLLTDPVLRPSVIAIETHPHLWQELDADGFEMCRILRDADYVLTDLTGKATQLEERGWILAEHRSESLLA